MCILKSKLQRKTLLKGSVASFGKIVVDLRMTRREIIFSFRVSSVLLGNGPLGQALLMQILRFSISGCLGQDT